MAKIFQLLIKSSLTITLFVGMLTFNLTLPTGSHQQASVQISLMPAPAFAESDKKSNDDSGGKEQADHSPSLICVANPSMDNEHDNKGHGNNEDGVDTDNPGKSKEGMDSDSSVDDEMKGSANHDNKDHAAPSEPRAGEPCVTDSGESGTWQASSNAIHPRSFRMIHGQ